MSAESLDTTATVPRADAIDDEGIRLPNSPQFIDRLNLAYARRSTEFLTWANTITDRRDSTKAASHAAEIETRIDSLKANLRDAKDKRRQTNGEIRDLKRGNYALGGLMRKTRIGSWIESKATGRLAEREEYYKEQIRQMEAAIVSRKADLLVAKGNKATFDDLINKKAVEISEPLQHKLTEIELKLDHVKPIIEQLENETRTLAAAEADAHAQAASIDHRLNTEDLDDATEAACNAEFDRFKDTIAETAATLKDRRSDLDKAYRHRARCEAAHRTIVGGDSKLKARYSRVIEEVARPVTSGRSRDAIAAANAIRPAPARTPEPTRASPRPPRAARAEPAFDHDVAAPDMSHIFATGGEPSPVATSGREEKPTLIDRISDAIINGAARLWNRIWPWGKKRAETGVSAGSPEMPVMAPRGRAGRRSPSEAETLSRFTRADSSEDLPFSSSDSSEQPRPPRARSAPATPERTPLRPRPPGEPSEWESIYNQKYSNKDLVTLLNKIVPGLDVTSMSELAQKWDPEGKHAIMLGRDFSDEHESSLENFKTYLSLMRYGNGMEQSEFGRLLEEKGISGGFDLERKLANEIIREDNASGAETTV